MPLFTRLIHHNSSGEGRSIQKSYDVDDLITDMLRGIFRLAGALLALVGFDSGDLVHPLGEQLLAAFTRGLVVFAACQGWW
jgi:hypothetical protein